MAMIPKNAVLIDNPISKAPGFQLENVFVMAGIPSIFRAMAESILPKLVGGHPLLSTTIRYLKPEGEIALFLEKIVKKYPSGQIGSYPFKQKDIYGTNIVLRHFDRSILKSVEKELKRGLKGLSD